MKSNDPARGGSRSDDSTQFSLRALAERQASPRVGAASTPSRDDSGLIDLRALAALEPPREEPAKLDVAPFAGVGLFDVPSPPTAPAAQAAPDPAPARARQRRRTAAIVAAAVTAVAAVSAIAIAGTHRPGDAQLPPVSALHTATVPVSPPPEPARAEPAPQADAKPSEVKPAETTAPPPSASPRASTAPRRAPKPAGSTVVKTEPPKAGPPCDLMCQMQKSVAKSR